MNAAGNSMQRHLIHANVNANAKPTGVPLDCDCTALWGMEHAAIQYLDFQMSSLEPQA